MLEKEEEEKENNGKEELVAGFKEKKGFILRDFAYVLGWRVTDERL